MAFYFHISTYILVEWVRGFTASLPLRDIHKPTPTFLIQRLDIVSRYFYDIIYYYSFQILIFVSFFLKILV
jgi:hypothetical protein